MFPERLASNLKSVLEPIKRPHLPQLSDCTPHTQTHNLTKTLSPSIHIVHLAKVINRYNY